MALFIVIPFFIALALLPGLIWLSNRYRVVDNPLGDILKIHTKATPHLGGIAVFLAFVVSMIFAELFFEQLTFGVMPLSALLASALAFFLLGVWDDIRWKHISTINPRLKLLLLVVVSLSAAFILKFSGVTFLFIPFIVVEIAFAFLYILGLVNAINFEDGLDGLAGGVGSLSLLGFVVVGAITGSPFVFSVALVCLGGFLAFLVFNFPPAKIFMGDGGAFFLGFVLAFLAILLSRPYDIVSVAGPLLIIGVPIFDTAATITRRIFNRTSPFLGDRDHLYDKIFRATGSIKKTVGINYIFQVICVIIGITITVS